MIESLDTELLLALLKIANCWLFSDVIESIIYIIPHKETLVPPTTKRKRKSRNYVSGIKITLIVTKNGNVCTYTVI